MLYKNLLATLRERTQGRQEQRQRDQDQGCFQSSTERCWCCRQGLEAEEMGRRSQTQRHSGIEAGWTKQGDFGR
jgi:hypothetical protein